ncbi:MAG: response regulator transcription factor, partial [Chitinophagaceae bacterium]|nr:response regulator transcription factor [Chitinophagaceae bacterium]
MATPLPIRVIIADDHDIYRDGLQLLLSKNPEIQIVGEADNGEKLVLMAKLHKPDVILTDLRMPLMDGIKAIKEINNFDSTIRMIALSSFDSEQMIVDALEAGALGYIVKNAQKGEIFEAIKTVYTFLPYYCKTTSIRLVKLISQSKFDPHKNQKKDILSQKEKEMIRLICEEKTSKEIGKTLFMSVRTVESWRRKISEKINAKTAVGITLFAIR